MSTSLADQLRRLKTPQTTLLVDSKKRASILFNPKEAAEKDRETIFDIGYSGFQELIKLNSSFLQFESSLFDKNARELQRAVEHVEVNRQLKAVIKKFLIHLSPYLLLQPTHKCLEWLIRRFNINLYEKTEFMMLILPYHETTIFVKCLQTMQLNDASDLWHWLEPVKKNGVPLSKQAMLNRVASDSYLMSFICESIVYAVNQLDTRAHTLQVYYAFFCTSIIGALDNAKINESHIKNIYGAVRKGIKSTSIDFCAASLMIIGQLVNKVKLKRKILESFVNMLLERVSHAKLQQDVIILLVLIYHNQNETIADISEECLIKLLANSKWLPPVLTKIYNENVNILPFYLPLLSACLKHIQLKSTSWKKCRKFCNALLTEIFFKPEHAESVIRCTLDSFILTEKIDDTVIEIDSDNENEDQKASDKSITTWYTNTLKTLERRYPTVFDAIVKEIVRSDNKSMSEMKKRSLKKVLSFLFTIVCTDDNVNLFEKLYHYNAQHRVEAIKYLVKNLNKMSFSDDSKSLLKGSIAERLNDDSPLVVKETLKFRNSALQRFMNKTELFKKYIYILDQTLQRPKLWEDTAVEAVNHLGELCSKSFPIDILISILPLILQPSELSAGFLRKIFTSELATHVDLIKAFKRATKSIGDDKDAMTAAILNVLESKKGLPTVGQIIAIKRTNEDWTLSKAYYTMLLLFYSYTENKLNPKQSDEILNLIEQFEATFKMGTATDNTTWATLVANGRYPLNIHIEMIKKIIDSHIDTVHEEFKAKPFEFSQQSTSLSLMRRIFEYFVKHMSRNKSKYAMFENGLKYFFEKLLPEHKKRIEYLSNYFTVDALYVESINKANEIISIKHQIFIINYINGLIQSEENELHSVQLELEPFIRILNALRSSSVQVREVAYETLVILKSTDQPKFKTLISKLIRRQSEIVMDENQLPLILFKIFDKKSSLDLKNNLTEFITYIASTKVNDFLVAHLLESLTHINSEEILKSIAHIAMEILTTAENDMEEMGKKLHQLDDYKSIIVRNILSRYTQQTITIIKKVPTTWQILLKSAELYGVLLKGKSKDAAITSVIVEVFNNDLFNELPAKNQRQLIFALVNSATYAENAGLYSNINKFFKQIQLNSLVCVDLLDEMAITDNIERMEVDEVPTAIQRQRRSSQCASDGGVSSELLKLKSWKRGITWLEFLQNKKDIIDPHLMIPSLFAILTKCLQFEDQSNVEYVKQLLLACIHQLCVIIAPEGIVQGNLISEKNFKIEPVVQCIRGTQNPQTHHHALQLLSHSARMLPEQVLHNMMDIFTFMGSSVVRHDDVYSFQIITNIISSIIPTLTRLNENKSENERNALVIPVLKVFSDIILDVPEHRRLPLYIKLLDTLNADNYLWMFLNILIDIYVSHHQPEVEKTTRQTPTLAAELPQQIEIALAITKEFDCKTIIVTATKLIKFLEKMPINKPTNQSEKVAVEISALFNLNAWTNRQFRHFKYEVIKFINILTSSVEFVNKVAVLSDDEAAAIKEYYQDAIISILTYIPIISKSTEQAAIENKHNEYWKVLLHNCFDTLENVISLLSSNVLLVVVHGLLSHKLSSVRRRVIELLINKLQHNPEIFNAENENDLVKLLGPLTKIIESIIDEKKLAQNASSIENTGIQQMALLAVKLLSKQLTEKYPKEFKHIVETLIDVLRKNEKVPRILLATVLLSLCEICSNLRVHSIAYLPSFMKIFLEILNGFSKPENISNDNVLICLVSGLLKIVSTLALYLSPYLVQMIVRLSQIWHNIESQPGKDPKRNPSIVDRMNGIWEKFSTALELRILIPTIDQSYKRIVHDEHSIAIGPLMQLLSQTFEQQTTENISRFMPDITSFFITALQFRSDHSNIDLDTLNALENKIIKSFRSLTLKLSEGSFRPLYYRIHDWAMKQSDKDLDRTITYFRLSVEIVKSLKSLFVLFANDFIDDIPELLNRSLASELAHPTEVQTQKTRLLIESVLETLYQVFLHDSRGFINGARFEALLQPLVDQIENEIVLDSSKSMELLSLALAQLGQAVNDDILWKQLNYQILMKTRNNESRIRLFALKVGVNLAAKLGEDYMSLLPETVPFISELLEDENPEVEKQCQLSVQELQEILGEPLQKYF